MTNNRGSTLLKIAGAIAGILALITFCFCLLLKLPIVVTVLSPLMVFTAGWIGISMVAHSQQKTANQQRDLEGARQKLQSYRQKAASVKDHEFRELFIEIGTKAEAYCKRSSDDLSSFYRSSMFQHFERATDLLNGYFELGEVQVTDETKVTLGRIRNALGAVNHWMTDESLGLTRAEEEKLFPVQAKLANTLEEIELQISIATEDNAQ